MDPWYKHVTPRREVREGRSFNPDEFAIALEQVVTGIAPDDYERPDRFFAHVLHAGIDRARGDGVAPAHRQDDQHRAGADPGDAVRARLDAYARRSEI